MAAVDFFLKLDGIEGESTDDKHRNEIEISSFSWGVSNPGSHASGGGGGAGKASFQDFHFTMQVSKASPELFMHVATGEHIKQGILIGRKAGSTQFEFIKWTFTDVLVSSYQHAGSSLNDSLPLEQVSISFQKIEVDYTTQSADGKPGTTFHGGWDLATNKKV